MRDDAFEQETETGPTPLSFKLMVVLATIYLGWRLVQGGIWVIQALSN